MKSVLVFGLWLLIVVSVPAAGAAEQEKRWVDEGEISFVNTACNSEVMSLAAKNE